MGASAPEPTPPRETSAAQTGSSVSTAIANSYLQNPNEITRDGTRTTQATGSQSFTDPYTGLSYDIPTFTVTQQLSDQQEAIAQQNDRASLNLSTLGADLSGNLGTQLTNNFSLGNEETEQRLFDLGRGRLDPMFAQRDDDLRTRLSNQGIKVGSSAYDREMGLLGQQENDAYNQLLLSGRGQASQELLAEDNQRINQIGALMSGGQVSMPQFQTAPQFGGMQATDNAAIIANSDAQKMNAWQQSQASMGSMLSGVGGLFALSDERAKEDKRKVGETKDGMGIYSYRYKGDPETRMGLMAQEVAKKRPEAVKRRPDGLMAVNYERALS